MLTLLINETKPLAGLFASTTGGIGSVPDISVADEGQAVSVQTFTRTAGVITDSFVAGDVLHIGIGDGVNAPVCYIELSSASPATGTMAINTVGMVALFAATSANQLTLNVGVVRTRGGYTNTIFSAPIVIYRSVIDPDTAVPTPSILGTGVAAALKVAINTALGFVRLDASARYPALDGSQITNLAGGSLTVGTTAIASGTTGRILYDNAGVLGELPVGTGVATALAVNVGSAGAFLTSAVTSITGTANEITVTGTTTPTLSLPSALTFTGKTVTGGTFNAGAFNGTVGATTPSTIAGTTGTFSGAVSTTGNAASIFTGGASASIFTLGENGNILTMGASGYIETRSTYKLNSGSFITTLSHAPTANRAIAFPDADGTLALVSGDLGTPSAIVLTNASGTASININGTVGATTPSTVAGTTATFGAGNFTVNADGDCVAASFATYAGGYCTLRSDGTAKFYNGAITLGYDTGTAAWINSNGAASFASGYCAINSFGNIDTDGQISFGADSGFLYSDGSAAFRGTVAFQDSGGTPTASINGNSGSASFASGTFTATTSLLLGTAGSAVGTIGFRNATSGTTTLQPATGALGTGTVTLPLSGTLAISSGAQTFTGVQSMTSPAITTSITTPSTTFTAFAGATTLATIGGTGATAVVAIPGTLDASNSTTGSVTMAGGLAVAKKIHLGDSFIVTKSQNASTECQIANTNAGIAAVSALRITNNIGSAYIYAGSSNTTTGFEQADNRIAIDSVDLDGVSISARGASADIRFYTDGPANANEKMRLHNSGGLSLGNTTDPGASNASITGTLAVTGVTTLTGLLTANGGITLGDAQNIAFNTTTGTKIGAATTQKLSFWNATPIVQPTTAVASATVAHTGGGTNIKTDDTFDGYTIAQVVKALRNAGLLA